MSGPASSSVSGTNFVSQELDCRWLCHLTLVEAEKEKEAQKKLKVPEDKRGTREIEEIDDERTSQ